jgi:hypothetical protein
MAYNSASAQIPAQNLYPWQSTPFSQSSIADPYKGSKYTGSDKYTPPAPNPEDYFSGAGYSQIPMYDSKAGYKPYDTAGSYQPSYIDPSQTSWANANLYAPWSNPQGPGGVEFGGNSELSLLGGNSPYGSVDRIKNVGILDTYMDSLSPAPLVSLLGGGDRISKLFGDRKKRRSLNYSSPSYQGYMFTPQEGFPEYYNPSPETISQTQDQIYSQQPQSAAPSSYDYNYSGGGSNSYGGFGQNQGYSNQNYVGQQDQAYGSLYNNNNKQNSLYDTFKV